MVKRHSQHNVVNKEFVPPLDESNHEDASDTGTAPKQQQQVIPQTTAISNIKLPILKKEEYDYIAYGDGALTLSTLYTEYGSKFRMENSKKRFQLKGWWFVREQIDDVDIEEMDINWQIAMIAIRMKKFYKKTGRRVRVDGKTPGYMMERRRRDSLYPQHQEAGPKRRIRMCLADNGEWGLSNGETILKLQISTSTLTSISSSNETPTSIASEEKDEEVELIVVPSAVRIPEEKDVSRTSSTNSKKEDFSTDSLEDNPRFHVVPL
ncbi:hypothetical protein Tco_1274315 [Tanacetum coccineum]